MRPVLMNRIVYLLWVAVGLVASSPAAEPPITALTFTPDSQSLVVSSQAGASVYSWPELKPQRALNSVVENPHDARFSVAGDRIAIAGGRPAEVGVVEIMAWPSGTSLAKFNKHIDTVMSVAWLSNSTVATASLDHDVRVWNIESGLSDRTLSGHSRGVTSLCYLGTSNVLVSCGIDQSLRVWNIESGELLHSLSIHTQQIHDLALRPGEHGLPLIASASDDKTVRFWQPTIGRMVRFVRLSSEPLDLEWLPDGSAVAASCTDGHVRLIDPDSVEVIHDIRAIDEWAYSLAVHPSDGSLAVGGAGGSLQRITIQRDSE